MALANKWTKPHNYLHIEAHFILVTSYNKLYNARQKVRQEKKTVLKVDKLNDKCCLYKSVH